MALLFLDSFDHYGPGSSASIGAKWDGGVSSPQLTTTLPRTGTAALSLSGASFVSKLVTPGDVFILGFAVRFPAHPLTYVVRFQESATVHVEITTDASGFLVVKRGSTVLATATTNALAINNWYYLEVKVVIHDTTGSVVCRVDGLPVSFSASLVGIDTRNVGTGIVDRFVLGGVSTSPFLLFDDLYICDDAGTTNNDFLGICVVERLLPQTGNGDLADFTPSTGTDHGALVDENPPNDDTDYNVGDTAGQQDCYQYPSLALTGAILGLQTNLYARKTDAGVRTVAPIVRLGSVTYPGAAVAPTTSYSYLTAIRETNPATGVAWTSADITALQAGMKIVS